MPNKYYLNTYLSSLFFILVFKKIIQIYKNIFKNTIITYLIPFFFPFSFFLSQKKIYLKPTKRIIVNGSLHNLGPFEYDILIFINLLYFAIAYTHYSYFFNNHNLTMAHIITILYYASFFSFYFLFSSFYTIYIIV